MFSYKTSLCLALLASFSMTVSGSFGLGDLVGNVVGGVVHAAEDTVGGVVDAADKVVEGSLDVVGDVIDGVGNIFEGGSTRVRDPSVLYNQWVYRVEKLAKRNHYGCRVTFSNGSRWLIQREGSHTVVDEARDLPAGWSVIESKNFGGRRKMYDLYISAQNNFYPFFNY